MDTPPKPTQFLPWQPQSQHTGNRAIGNLQENLLARLRDERGVHAETLLAAIGAIAGFAAQNAALLEAASITREAGAAPFPSLYVIGATSGAFLSGDLINRRLIHQPGSSFALWGFIAGAAEQAGVRQADFPEKEEAFKHVMSTLGSPAFGVLRCPENNRPAMPPVDLLKLLWPMAVQIFTLPLPPGTQPEEPPLPEEHWPIIASATAFHLLAMSKDVLNPRVGFSLVLESAIIASKMHPEAITPRRWDLQAKGGGLAVTRLAMQTDR